MPKHAFSQLSSHTVASQRELRAGGGGGACTQLLRAYAASRGLTAQMGRPDEHRAGREMLKDYRDGKMLGCRMPPPPDAEGRDAATAPVVYWVPTLAPRARNMGSRAEAAATSRVSSTCF